MRSLYLVPLLLILPVSCKSTSGKVTQHARNAFVVPSFEEEGESEDGSVDSAATRDVGFAASGTASCASDATALRCMHFVKNDDAKSITVEFPGNTPQAGKQLTVYVAGIEALDLKSNQSCERTAAQKLKRRMTEALQAAKRVDIIKMVRMKTKAIQADIQVDGRSLAALLQEEKLVRAFGSKGKPDWCETPEAN